MKMHVSLFYHKAITPPHANQIFTGFKALSKQGLIQLSLHQTNESVFVDASLPIVRACIDGEVNLIYDTLDGYRFDHSCSLQENVKLLDKVLNSCDFYFKRSFSSALNSTLTNTNIYRLGLNVKLHNELYSELLHTKLLSKEFAKLLIGKSRTLANLFNQEYYGDHLFQTLNSLPAIKKDYFYPNSILYLTRSRDPYGQALPEDLVEERHSMNELRAACIRACRKEFGSYFVGGISDSAFARSAYPDLVMPKSLTRQSNYFRLIQEASICVATNGLHDSIGWKVAEYVSYSKAIVSEPLKYDLPGNFSTPANYLTFDSVDSLLNQINYLRQNQDKLIAMMKSNYAYYHNWVRPDAMVLNTLLKAMSLQSQLV
ncbi:hypothetical protein G8759_30635 [Spirosoma aureum]|uniref:Glycosyltransferase family 1 protein n=1 Tax=Spirosoma aureum TaxID=2692134 RepID=A0A6G9AWA3_9BACT|nr:hypothetical protein [Spirosoma aureum]QIP16690.1 hypothetical protein G8759_30635 [Spirosoma aureum]